MRALRVLGLADAPEPGRGTSADSSTAASAATSAAKNLICEDPANGEQFSIPCDDRLLAGARGDLSRFGQLEIEMESQLRPREIQARIRAGATVEQVASLAGTTSARVERFAYPVLLERASVVEKALKARPAIDGITAGTSVAETVAATLSARGHDGDVAWDAFKDDEGWVLVLTWSAGRSENRAHWLFHPGRDGGTLSARDEAAAEIVDPALRILRPLRPVRPAGVPSVLMDPTLPTEKSHRPSEASSRSAHPAGGKLTAPPTRPTSTVGDRPAARNSRFNAPMQPQNFSGGSAVPGLSAQGLSAQGNAVERIVEDTITDERAGVHPVNARDAAALTGTESAGLSPARATSPRPGPPTSRSAVTSSAASSPAATGSVAANTAANGPASPKSSKKGQRPSMPSWEDVLLGTRSTGH